MKTCKIHDCQNPVLAKMFCRKHYLRNYRYGDPEFTKSPKDYIPSGKDSPNYIHGQWDHPLYKTWSNMIRRCENPNDCSYKNYGARGITVCERWHNIQNFIDDMGERPQGCSLDRIDNEKGYYPENCRWTNGYNQSRNRRMTKLSMEKARYIRQQRANGVARKVLAEELGVSIASIKKVISNSHWPETD